MKALLSILVALSIVLSLTLNAQVERRDKVIFVEPKNEFMDSVRKALNEFYKKETTTKKQLQLDFNLIKAPKSIEDFTKYWHNKPVSQGITGMCWCYSATSFFESEIYRLTKREIKLSELYTVYWEYVEKARRFIQERGNSNFAEGSESNAVPRIWKKYGIVPANAYTGLLSGQPFHDHTKLFNELNSYLQGLKNSNAWNEEENLKTIKAILNHYLGEPPDMIIVDGKKMTPKEYFEKIIRLNLDDYVEVISLMEKPYYEYIEFEVPDNWWHSKDYYNIPLDEFMSALKKAIREGFTICIGGDVSEPGQEGHAGIAVVPTFDIPSDYIDENARQFRFSNGTTGDDHGVHLIGYKEMDGKDWYLIKDSGSSARNNNHPGYYFYHEDYVKLKMLTFMVHKDAIGNSVKIKNK
ncbi:MAG: Aminopeptidase C [Ignavibacteriae bacterium]|nr:MAG: Aminopeptidase C [Ignavibacteriota bacterium]